MASNVPKSTARELTEAFLAVESIAWRRHAVERSLESIARQRADALESSRLMQLLADLEISAHDGSAALAQFKESLRQHEEKKQRLPTPMSAADRERLEQAFSRLDLMLREAGIITPKPAAPKGVLQEYVRGVVDC